MSVAKRYVLDANVFIQAYRRFYGFDICPGFWTALIRQHKANRVCSIDKIKDELLAGKDDLSQWAKDEAPTTFFKSTSDRKVTNALGEMVKWVQSEDQFSQEAKAEFASAADGWLVAFAKVNHLIVVTHEEYAPDARKKVPMPNVCLEFDIDYCSTFEMLRAIKERFVLKTRRRRK